MLQLLAVTAALAAQNVDLPKLFAKDLPKVKARSEVPVLLPQVLTTEAEEVFPSHVARTHRWELQIGAVRGCGGATACFVADFAGTEGGRPRGARRVKLARGRAGRFTPLRCGASCAPPRIEWRERGATFRIEARVGNQDTERRMLVRMANSAIRHGPR